MSQRRHTADSITDDALDALYENATEGWRRGDRWKKRAERAEATVRRLAEWCDELDQGTRELIKDPHAEHPVAAHIRARLAEPKEQSDK